MVGKLSPAQQQQVEILRALAREADLIVLDEPTASLSGAETERLHEIVRGLRSRGQTVILVSHFLGEVLDLSDAITVLRDGRVVRTGPTADETEASLVLGMLGRPASRTYPDKQPPSSQGPIALSIEGMSALGVHDVSLAVRAGEILGLAGLVGAGRTELARAIYGANATTAGEVHVGDAALPGKPAASVRAGLAMIPESRKDDGLILRRPIHENVSLTSLPRLQRLGFVRRRAERALVRDALERVTGTSLLEAPAGSLSGGNQQKLLFARALLINPGVLIADEPTRGIDVGAKADVHQMIDELARGGMAIILISSDLPEVLHMSDRILVMREGHQMALVDRDDATPESVLAAAMGQTRPATASAV
jgi:ABC-type sugar transport system ATPase subunit